MQENNATKSYFKKGNLTICLWVLFLWDFYHHRNTSMWFAFNHRPEMFLLLAKALYSFVSILPCNYTKISNKANMDNCKMLSYLYRLSNSEILTPWYLLLLKVKNLGCTAEVVSELSQCQEPPYLKSWPKQLLCLWVYGDTTVGWQDFVIHNGMETQFSKNLNLPQATKNHYKQSHYK